MQTPITHAAYTRLGEHIKARASEHGLREIDAEKAKIFGHQVLTEFTNQADDDLAFMLLGLIAHGFKQVNWYYVAERINTH